MVMKFNAAWRGELGQGVLEDEPLEDGLTLSDIEIVAAGTLMTEAVDERSARLRRGGTLSAYHLAEWLAWHWWRLRWEPARLGTAQAGELGWQRAHCLGGIGGGWLWPNVTFVSDGTRMVLRSEPSSDAPAEPLRYLGGRGAAVPATAWEQGVDAFFEDVLARLDKGGLGQTDLARMSAELREERDDAELTAYRKIEARLGFDIDGADPNAVEAIFDAGTSLGQEAMAEVAADTSMSAERFQDAAKQCGHPSRPADSPRRIRGVGYGDAKPPWQVGVDAARRLRKREALGDGPLADKRLAELCAIGRNALQRRPKADAGIAFALNVGSADRVVLRSNWRTGRRFEAARLLGDRLIVNGGEPLRPATAAFTYRQKMQRAFAAELLCPIDALVKHLDDLADENRQQTAADHFEVSAWTVASLLANNGYLERDAASEPDFAVQVR